MAHLAKRVLVRCLAISPVLVTILALAVLSFHENTRPVQAQEAARVAVVSAFFDAIARGDVAGALAQFADDAFYVGGNPTGNCSTQAPCNDLEGIRQQLQFNVGQHTCLTIRNVQVAGSVVLGTTEVRADQFRARGIERALVSFIAQIPQDKITLYVARFDLTDPQSALQVALATGTAQPTSPPIPNPGTPCA